MRLDCIRISNFQCFGPEPTTIKFDEITVLIGPNGSGKTAALQALCRMFGFDPTLRKIQYSDFHVSTDGRSDRRFWVEADFVLDELANDAGGGSAVASHFKHMRLDSPDGMPVVRFKLDARLNDLDEVEYDLGYVAEVAPDGKDKIYKINKLERNDIQIHYLPARRDPSSHITYGVNTMLGRLLRSVNWNDQKENVTEHACKASECLEENGVIDCLNEYMNSCWEDLHKGDYFREPEVKFGSSDIDSILKQLTIQFKPDHHGDSVEYSMLSDGQKSLLYITLVVAMHDMGQAVLRGEVEAVDVKRFRPATFSILAVEEPENSLAPHYLGRIIDILDGLCGDGSSQAVLATHAPSILKRVEPSQIRYMRLNKGRISTVKMIVMPDKADEAHKYVRQAVMAYPEIYFARLVVLGEGDSEMLVLPKLFDSKEICPDHFGVVIAPLGGRHVNFFWRLLYDLEIPFVTLLDLDVARYQGGWGRLSYAYDKLKEFDSDNGLFDELDENYIEEWNSNDLVLSHFVRGEEGCVDDFERANVYFSAPLDLDFSMLESFPEAYGIEDVNRLEEPSESVVKSVLGDSYFEGDQYTDRQKKLFPVYHKLFKLGSKPASHMQALSNLDGDDLDKRMPDSLSRLIDKVREMLEGLPE